MKVFEGALEHAVEAGLVAVEETQLGSLRKVGKCSCDAGDFGGRGDDGRLTVDTMLPELGST
jgi:hypothetical protein